MRRLILILLLLPAVAHPASADGRGLRIGLGTGTGRGLAEENGLHVYEDDELVPRPYGRDTGPAFNLRVETDLTPLVSAGIDATVWSRGGPEGHLDQTVLAAAVIWRHDPTGLHARLGYGLGIARLEAYDRGFPVVERDTGSAYLLAVGWNLSLGRGLSLGPRIAHTGFVARELDVWASTTVVTLSVDLQIWE